MKRIFDILVGLLALAVLLLPIVIIALAVRITSAGPVLYWSDRIGLGGQIIKMPKFRSMRVDVRCPPIVGQK